MIYCVCSAFGEQFRWKWKAATAPRRFSSASRALIKIDELLCGYILLSARRNPNFVPCGYGTSTKKWRNAMHSFARSALGCPIFEPKITRADAGAAQAYWFQNPRDVCAYSVCLLVRFVVFSTRINSRPDISHRSASDCSEESSLGYGRC